MSKENVLEVKSTEHDKWFDLLHRMSEYKMEFVGGEGKKKQFRLYEKTELGFCFKEHCMGASPGEAFANLAKSKDALFTVTIKSIF